ncbi:MAG: hypothetical protein HRT56_06830 [Coraliomargarita sp.]|nr:hypothetical protein [Coraliomargarita sp.]
MALYSSDQSPRVLRLTWTTRDDLRANRDLVFVYGDNVAREGQRGLARQMRGEPNAHPISISWTPFEPFTHASAPDAIEHISKDLEALQARTPKLIVWPLGGLVPEFLTFPDELHQHLRTQAKKRFALVDPV